SNQSLVFHQIDVTDPKNKNGFYSGSQVPNFVDLHNSQQDSLLPELGSS
ncbi:unnamed protein product, partial [Brassica oleracea]